MVMACAFAAMLIIDIFALRVSSITLLIIAAAASLILYAACQNTERGGVQ
jgi:hypothetical protein